MSKGCQKTLCQYANMSVCQYVSISICQNAPFQLRYQNESWSECHQDVRQSLCHYDNMSKFQYVRMQLFSLGIKMKVGQNVIMMSGSQKISTDS